MLCPFCNTENRDDRESCYSCKKDISMLRLIVNKAKHHYNIALEHAERGRFSEAIVELENVLDLDSKHVNAHVVLGTIYAKMENYDQAVVYWQRALDLDHRFAKAHDYLVKTRTITAHRTLRKLVRSLVVFLLLAVGTAAVVAMMYFNPSKDIVHARQAYDAYKDQDFLKAMEITNGLNERSENEHALLLAELIETAVTDKIGGYIGQIDEKIIKGDYSEALELMKEMGALRPGAEMSETIVGYRKKISGSFVAKLDNAFASFDDTDESYTNLIGLVEQAHAMGEELDTIDGLEIKLAGLTQQFLNHQMLLIESSYAEKKNFEETIESLIALGEQFDIAEFRELIQSRIDSLIAGKSDRLEDEARQLIESGNSSGAIEKITELEQHFQKFDISSTMPEEFRNEIRTAETLDFIEIIKTLDYEERFEELLDASSSFDPNAMSEEDRKVVDDLKDNARRKIAVEQWEWYFALDMRFVDKRISEQVAQKAVERYEFTIDNLPKSYGYAKDNVIFYVGVAYERLGETEKARELYQTLVDDYAATAYASTARKELEGLAEDLTMPPVGANR